MKGNHENISVNDVAMIATELMENIDYPNFCECVMEWLNECVSTKFLFNVRYFTVIAKILGFIKIKNMWQSTVEQNSLLLQMQTNG